MKSYLSYRVLPLLASALILTAVIISIEPPPNWRSATITEILTILLPILFTLTFLLSLVLLSFTRSFIIALTVLVLVVLNSLGELDFANTALTITTGMILLVVLGNFSLLKLRRKAQNEEEEKPPTFRTRRQTRIRRLSKLTTMPGIKK